VADRQVRPRHFRSSPHPSHDSPGVFFYHSFAGPPRIPQLDFAKAAGIDPSRLSRIIKSGVTTDRDGLDAIIAAVKTRPARVAIVTAYVKDVVSPMTLTLLESEDGKNPWANVDINRFSKKGLAALNALAQSDHLPNVERVLVDLATLFDLI
jgi:hypothetical protein